MDTNGIETNAAPKPEALQSKELLNKDQAGLQASVLLDGLKWAPDKPDKTISEKDLRDVQTKIKDKSFKTEKITNGSNLERDEYWNGVNSEYKGQSYNEQMAVWKDKTKKFIEGRSFEEKEVLKKLGWEAENVEEGYKKYFGLEKDGGHNGDVAYFARKVAEVLKRDEIKSYAGLIEKIGGFYGKDSAKVARLLTEGVKNLEDETFDEFAKEAMSQFNNGFTPIENDLIDGLNERSEKWVNDQKQKEERIKKEEELRKEKERLRKEKEKKTDEGQSEKEIRGLMVPLIKFDEDIKKKATEEKFDFGPNFKFEDNFTEDQIKRIKETEWGKGLIGEYQKKFELLTRKINEAIEAKSAKFEETKIEELKAGDIFREKGKDEHTLMFEGKGKKIIKGAEKGVYTYNIVGKDFEFIPKYDITEEDSKGVVLQKLVFGAQAQKSEAKTPEAIGKEIDGAIEKYNKSDSELVRKFVPILESLKGDHSSIPEEDYKTLVGKALAVFEKVQGMEVSGIAKKQLEGFLEIFDSFYAGSKMGLDLGAKTYCEERMDKIKSILKEEGVEIIEGLEGKKFDPKIMEATNTVEVEEDKVDTVTKEIRTGFNINGESLRVPMVEVGVRKGTIVDK